MSTSEQILLPDIGDFDAVDVIEVLVEVVVVVDGAVAQCSSYRCHSQVQRHRHRPRH